MPYRVVDQPLEEATELGQSRPGPPSITGTRVYQSTLCVRTRPWSADVSGGRVNPLPPVTVDRVSRWGRLFHAANAGSKAAQARNAEASATGQIQQVDSPPIMPSKSFWEESYDLPQLFTLDTSAADVSAPPSLQLAFV